MGTKGMKYSGAWDNEVCTSFITNFPVVCQLVRTLNGAGIPIIKFTRVSGMIAVLVTTKTLASALRISW
jgi:hypothetical protein